MKKEIIDAIEDLPLKPGDIWYVYLVALGKKKSAWIDFASDIWRDGQEPKHIDPARIESVKNTFEVAGLKYHINTFTSNAGIWAADDGGDRLREVCEIFISLDGGVLNNLVQATKKMDHQATGYYLGFPETAVEAFSSGEFIEKEDINPEIRFSELMSFTQFRLSKKSWNQELSTAQDWLDTLKSVRMNTYYDCRRQFGSLDDKTRKIMIEYYQDSLSK